MQQGHRKIQVGSNQYNINVYSLYKLRHWKVDAENADEHNDLDFFKTTQSKSIESERDLRLFSSDDLKLSPVEIPGYSYIRLYANDEGTNETIEVYDHEYYYDTYGLPVGILQLYYVQEKGDYVLEIKQGDNSFFYAADIPTETSDFNTLQGRMYLEKDGEEIHVYCVEPEAGTSSGAKYNLDAVEAKENLFAALATTFLEQTYDNNNGALDDALAKALVWQSLEAADPAYKNAADKIIAVSSETLGDFEISELSEEDKEYIQKRKAEIEAAIWAYENKVGAEFTLVGAENAKLENGVLTVEESESPVVISLTGRPEVLKQYMNAVMEYPDGVTGSIEKGTLTLTIDTTKVGESGAEMMMSMIAKNVPKTTLKFVSNYQKQTLMQFGIADPLEEKLLIKRTEKQKPETPDEPDTPDEPETPDTPETPDEPETPETPDIPDEPEIPETPDTPDQPETPETPENPTPDTPENPTPENPQPTSEQPPVTPEFPTPELPPVTPVVPVFEVPTTPETPAELPELPEFVAVLGATRVEAPAEAPAVEDHGAVLGATRTESLGDIQTGDNSDMVRYLGTGSIGILLLCGWMLTKRRRAKKA